MERGRLYFRENRFDKAFSDFNQIININPRHAKAFLSRGNVYVCKGKIEKALSDYQRAVELDPELTLAYMNQSVIYLNIKEYKQGIKISNEGIKIAKEKELSIENKTELSRLYTQRGVLYGRLKQFNKALKDYDNAIKTEPHNPIVYYNKGEIYEKIKKNNKEALIQYKKCLELLNDKNKIKLYILASPTDASNLFPKLKKVVIKRIKYLEKEEEK